MSTITVPVTFVAADQNGDPQLAAAFYGAYVNDLGIEAKGNLMALMPATPMPQQTAG